MGLLDAVISDPRAPWNVLAPSSSGAPPSPAVVMGRMASAGQATGQQFLGGNPLALFPGGLTGNRAPSPFSLLGLLSPATALGGAASLLPGLLPNPLGGLLGLLDNVVTGLIKAATHFLFPESSQEGPWAFWFPVLAALLLTGSLAIPATGILAPLAGLLANPTSLLLLLLVGSFFLFGQMGPSGGQASTCALGNPLMIMAFLIGAGILKLGPATATI